MPTTIQDFVLQAPGAGGANEKLSGNLIDDNQSARPDASNLPLLNVHTNEIGEIVQRNGYTVYSGPLTTTNSIGGMFQYRKFNGNEFELAIGDNGTNKHIWDISTPASPVDVIGGVTFTSDTRFTFASVADKLIVTSDDNDSPITWSGTGNFSYIPAFVQNCYLFLASSISVAPAVGDTYSNNSVTYTVIQVVGLNIYATGSGAPQSSGNLTRVSGSGDSTIAYSSNSAISAISKPKFCMEFNNYAFYASTSDNPERTYWSNLFDPFTVTATDFQKNNDAVTGIGKSQDNLFIFTRRGITLCKYTGDSLFPFTFDNLDTTIGTLSPHSIISAIGTIFWVGNDNHVYRMNGYNPERVTETIPTTISEMNSNAINKCVAIEHRELRQIWFFYPKESGTTNNFVVVYDYLNNQIFMYDNIDANAVANFQSSSGAVLTYFGDRTGRVYITNVGNTDYLEGTSTAIQSFKYTKMFNWGDPGKAKRLRRVRATVNAQDSCLSTIEVSGDFGSSGGEVLSLNHQTAFTTIGEFIIGTSILGGATSVKVDNDAATTARYLQFKCVHSQNEVPYKIRDLVFSFQQYDGGNR